MVVHLTSVLGKGSEGTYVWFWGGRSGLEDKTDDEGLLRAKNLSSERIATALTRRTDTMSQKSVSSGEVYGDWGGQEVP
jgi:hypothetical protein